MEELLPLLSPLVSALVAVFGAYQAVKRTADERERKYADSIARLETKMDVLSERVEKHNNLVERMSKAEVEINNLYHRYDDMKIGGTE